MKLYDKIHGIREQIRCGFRLKKKTASEDGMKYEKFGWYDAELWLWKHWKLCLLIAVCIIAAVLVCTQPLVTKYDRTFSGYELEYDSTVIADFAAPAAAQPASIHLEGKLYRYLLKPDRFEGIMTVDGFPYRMREDLDEAWWKYETDIVQFEISNDWTDSIRLRTGPAMEYRRGEESLNDMHASLKRGREFFYLHIWENGRIAYGDEHFIIAPAETAEDAHELFIGSVWTMWQEMAETSAALQGYGGSYQTGG